MIPDCTLTTCCFDLTKYNAHSRPLSETVSNMDALLSVPCYLIIYTDNHLYHAIKEKRSEYQYDHLTHYIVTHIEELDTFQYLDRVKENRKTYHPTKDERTCPESHLVCCSKFELVLKSIRLNPFSTTTFGWIDSNVGVNFSKICVNYQNHMLLQVLHRCSESKFHLQILNVCSKDYIQENQLRDYYSTYRWVVCGCLFVTGKEVGIKVLTSLWDTFVRHTLMGYGHGEEMFYLEVLEKHDDCIERGYGDYHHILNNFHDVTVGLDYILQLTDRYISYKYFRECEDCCAKVLRQYRDYKIPIDDALCYRFYFNWYVSMYYVNKDRAKEIVSEIQKAIQCQPRFRETYEANKEFYDKQFSYCN